MTARTGRLRAALDRFERPLHALLALAIVALLAGSPWLAMASRLPRQADLHNLAHVGIGLLALVLVGAHLLHCTLGGRWRLYWPWLDGRWEATRRDVAGLVRGRMPTVEGGGLLAAIEGLLLLAVLAAAVSGAGWLLVQGSDLALDWSDWHGTLGWVAAGLLALHVLGVASHWLDFIRG